jgi:hypothetical protein
MWRGCSIPSAWRVLSHRLLVALAAAVSVWAVAAFYFDIQIA